MPSPSTQASAPETCDADANGRNRLPLQGWALELARRWNSDAYSMFVLQGNIFDVFPVQESGSVSYLPLKSFLARRFFFQAEDGIRDGRVTGVQTCALPI